MKMYLTRTLSLIMFLTTFCLVSCFDDKYDLKKDIDLSVSVGGTTLVLPLGETESITLDKVIDESETFKLGVDSIYAFKKKDNIDDVNIDVDAVNITIDNPEIDPIDIDFGDNTQIDPFKVELADPSFNVTVADIVVDDSKMPEVDIAIDQTVPCAPNQHFSQTFSLSNNKNISVAMDPTSLKDVKEIKEVFFGKKQGEMIEKQLVTFRIDTKEILKMLNPGATQELVSLTVTFPEGFVLSEYQNYNNTLNIHDNVLEVKPHQIGAGENMEFQFYADKFVHSFSKTDYDYEGNLKFDIKFKVDGTFKADPTLSGKFAAGLSAEKFTFDKALVVTEDVDVEVESGIIRFDTDIDGLSDLASVKKITFKDQTVFDLKLNKLNLPFDFQADSRFVIEVPQILNIVPVNMPEGVVFNAADNHLIIPASILHNDNVISLGMQGIDFTKQHPEGKTIENGHLQIAEEVKYYAETDMQGVLMNDKLVVQGGKPLFTSELSGLNQQLNIVTNCGTAGSEMIEVENAMVVANSVSANVSTDTDFEVSEEMPEEVKSLKSVSLKGNQPAKFTLKVNFEQMPRDIKKGILLDPLTVILPKFILFGKNPDIDENNVMTLHEQFIPSEENNFTYEKVIEVYGMDFTKIKDYQDKGIEIGEDKMLIVPKQYTKVDVTGEVRTAEGEEVNSKNFESFQIFPTVDVEDMVIGEVVGKVDPVIDPVEELVDLDLDSDLDFLKNDSSELHLKNPIINVKLTSNVGVPVNLDLAISGHKYDVDTPIDGSLVTANTARFPEFKLYPAIDREHPVTTQILISREPQDMPEDTEDLKNVNLVLPDLSNLLVHLPDQVKFKLNAAADQSTDHIVDITPNYNNDSQARFKITGDYDVNVPLVFEEMDILYKDSVDNLQEDLWDFLDIALAAELDIHAELINQLPANLNLKATAVDIIGNELKTIRLKVFINDVEDGVIPGVPVEGQKVTVPLRIELRAKDTDELKRLDKLRFNIGAKINQTINGLPLKGNQSIQLINVKAHVKKVNLDLN